MEGRPEPVVTWTFNGANVRVNSRVSIVSSGLHIVSVRDDDRGVYRCRAENPEGVITAAARLSVQGELHQLEMLAFVYQGQDFVHEALLYKRSQRFHLSIRVVICYFGVYAKITFINKHFYHMIKKCS